MDQIAIIVVHFNADADTDNCLFSLQKMKHSGLNARIIVVDNGSKTQYTLPGGISKKNIELIRSEANLGFTGGNNLGIWHARQHYHPDYFVLLNNDTYVDREFLVELVNTAKENPKAGLVVSKIYFAKGEEYHRESYDGQQLGNIIWYAGGSVDWNNLDAFHHGVDEVDRTQFDQTQPTGFATGCCVLIPREVVETVGLLDKRFFLYLEDVDYSLRVQDAGLDVLYCHRSKVWHKNAGSSGGAGSATSLYYQTRNRLFLAFKHGDERVKLRAIRVAAEKLISGQALEQRAVIDLLFGRMGKQPVL